MPTKELAYADAVRTKFGALPLAYQALVAHETSVHAEIARALESAEIRRVDALPALRAVIASGQNPYFMDWDGHPNALGYEAIAMAVAALFEQARTCSRQASSSVSSILAGRFQ